MHIYPINLFISDTSDTVIRGILLRRTSAAVCDVYYYGALVLLCVMYTTIKAH